MQDLIKTYKQKGDFTHAQKCNYFISPSDEIVNMIINSDDYNFRKACLMAILDFNPDIVLKKYTKFFKHVQVTSVLDNMLVNHEE